MKTGTLRKVSRAMRETTSRLSSRLRSPRMAASSKTGMLG